jgi:pyruvate dehydrogenase E2 component (dihydrolipoyllysine-residue acetyltransferase)
MTELRMPAYGISDAGGRVSKWLKREGQKVEKGEALVEIETEKAVAELEAPNAGRLVAIVAVEGANVESGQTLALIQDDTGITSKSEDSIADRSANSKALGSSPQPRELGGFDATKRVPDQDVPNIKASPGARRLCAESAVDINKIVGTGPQGRIVESDVKAFLEAESKRRKSVIGLEKRTEPLTSVRRSIAERMVESIRSIPHFHLSIDVDAKGIKALRQVRFAGQKPSVTAVVLKALGDTLKEWPRLNSSWGDGCIEIHEAVHINIAIATARGLLAPVVRNVPLKSISELDGELRELASRTKDGNLRLEDCSQGTFTLTNLGMYGIRQFDAVVNPPQCCILAVGSIRESPFARNGLVGIREEMTLTLAVDHRIVDGAEAAQFLSCLGRRLEELAPEPKSAEPV